MLRRRFLKTTAAAVLAAGAYPTSSLAQTIGKPLRIMVGFPPGGSSDVVARLVGDKLRGAYAPSTIVDNRPGGGGRLALDQLKRAEPDGTTIVISPASMLVVYPHIFKNLSYDSLKDFVPLAMLCRFPFALSVGPSVPASVRTLDDFVAWGKANQKQLSYGSPAAGSMAHFAGLLFARGANLPMLHVAYKGGAPALQDLIGGQIPSSINVLSEALPLAQAGKLRILATTGSRRSRQLPDTPTFKEVGYKDLEVQEWFGAFAPAATPPAVVRALHAALSEALRSNEVAAGFEKLNFEPASESLSDFQKTVAAELDRWGPVVKASGFALEE